MNPKVNVYFKDGCGRCALFATPECKVHNWTAELAKLREIILGCGLDEELKWGVPVYTFERKNIFLISAFKENCTINFFKGALLKDENKILQKPGENTQAGRVIRFTDVREIIELENVLKAYIYEAVEVEKAGLEVKMKKTSEFKMPEEFKKAIDNNSDLKSAFNSLTPGRQRGYLLHFSQPKQSKTRQSRIEKCMQKILDGVGFNDR